MSSVCSTVGTRNVSTPQVRASWLRTRGLRREREQRDRRAVPRHPAGGVTGLGERDQELGLDPVGDLDRGVRDRAADSARLPVHARDQVESLVLDVLDDARHRLDCADRIATDARLGREHDRVRTVEDGVRDVARLGPGRAWVRDHRLEHLGGHDRRPGAASGQLERTLLDHRHLLERQLDPEVAASDHDRVERVDRRPRAASTASGFSILAITGSRTPSSAITACTRSTSDAERTNDRATRSARRCSAHRRSSMSLSVSAGVLTATPGKLIPLWSLTSPPTWTMVSHRPAVDPGHLEHDLAVVDQDPVSPLDVVGEVRVGRRALPTVTRHVLGGDRERVAVGEQRPDRTRTTRVGSSVPAGRPAPRRSARSGRRRRGSRCTRARGRPWCRGSD